MTNSQIHNKLLKYDNCWEEIVSLQNLEIAWARARQEMMRESLCDEIELRLFEFSLGDNLQRLHYELSSYALDAEFLPRTLSYAFPKDENKCRPRGLTWLEAEIIMIAVIQVIGTTALQYNMRSFAYRLSSDNTPERGPTEYLYEWWTEAWKEFQRTITNYIKMYPKGSVFVTDIEAFFTQIQQNRLKNLIKQEFPISKNIEWIIDILIRREIPDHREGYGLVQGSIGSGFWANIYLLPIDRIFPINDAYKRQLYRYVDDICVIIPDRDDEKRTIELVQLKIKELSLNPNPNKTKCYSASEYLSYIQLDESIDLIQEEYERLLSSMWQMTSDLREHFKKCNKYKQFWWPAISRYRSCLIELGIFITEAKLSREIVKYIAKDDFKKADLLMLDLPADNSIQKSITWASEFKEQNPEWNNNVSNLRKILVNLFFENATLVLDCEANEQQKKTASRRMRFSANRLAVLGLEQIHSLLTRFMCESPWLIREPKNLIEYLARQGFSYDIWKILDTHITRVSDSSPYMSAITVRSIQFLPILEINDWERLNELIFCDNEIIKLMASEVWLSITSKKSVDVAYDRNCVFNKIVSLLEDGEIINHRVLKNYLLILGSIKSTNLEKYKSAWEISPMIIQACSIAEKGSTSSLFKDVEPEVLRRRYYSSKYIHYDDLSGSY